MNLPDRYISKIFFFLFLFSTGLNFSACNRAGSQTSQHRKEIISFRSLNGIPYTEVARYMKNGLSFNEYGYQLEPQWKMRFISDDSVSIYSPTKKSFINFPLTRGYDSIFNTARSWLKVRKMSKDSLVLEILKAVNDSLEVNGAKVFMKFYADNYIKNVLHSDTVTLRHPSRKDTLFIRSLVAKANRSLVSAFPARQPVILTPKSPLVKIELRKTQPDLLNNFDTSDDYLSPEFYITIQKAYQDFYYSFSMYVDANGQMYYGKPLVPFLDEDARIAYTHNSEAIMNSYLKFYLNIKPGKTLDMPHTSLISVHVEGKAGTAPNK